MIEQCDAFPLCSAHPIVIYPSQGIQIGLCAAKLIKNCIPSKRIVIYLTFRREIASTRARVSICEWAVCSRRWVIPRSTTKVATFMSCSPRKRPDLLDWRHFSTRKMKPKSLTTSALGFFLCLWESRKIHLSVSWTNIFDSQRGKMNEKWKMKRSLL